MSKEELAKFKRINMSNAREKKGTAAPRSQPKVRIKQETSTYLAQHNVLLQNVSSGPSTLPLFSSDSESEHSEDETQLPKVCHVT